MTRTKVGILTLFSMCALAADLAAQGPAHPKASMDSARIAGMADHAMSGPMDANMRKHMVLTPARNATRDDSLRAARVAADLKRAIAKYQDTAVAVADGYTMFLPNVKNQKVYHFTNYGRAFKEAFRFTAEEPTSLLYKRADTGTLTLVGAMYTMPRRANIERLNDRVPLSIARWHKHVNWCLPRKGDEARWRETKNGTPQFGPASPVATKAACDALNGEFHANLFGWMLHANVYEGSDLATIFGDDHGPGGHGGHTRE
jgi:hypothetical protein